MKVCIVLFFFFSLFNADAQLSADFSLGALQSFGKDKYELFSSTTQPVGVYGSTSKRYNKIGLRARSTLSKKITDRINVMLQTGFNFRINEEFFGKNYYYYTVPIQGGLCYKIFKKKSSILSINSFSGINVFKIQNKYGKQQSGFIQNGELSYSFIRNGFIKSIIVKAGYEYQIDNETYFFKSIDPFTKDEDFNYKVKRNQIYLAFGVGL